MQKRWMMKAVFSVVLVSMMPALTLADTAQQAKQMLTGVEDRSLQIVLDASRGSDPILRANAIEAMQVLPDRALPLAQLGLEDQSLVVRFVSLVTIGKLKLKSLGDAAARLLNDRSDSVRAAAMFAARSCDKQVDVSELAGMLMSRDPGLRANAAMLLGLMGDPSAVPMLAEMAAVPLRRASAVRQALVRVQIAEALVRLGDEDALDALRAGAFSQFDEVRVLAVSTLGKLEDRRMQAAFFAMVSQPPIELQLAAAEALARMGVPDGLPAMLKGAESELPPVRAQAAFGLGLVRDVQAATVLVTLLDDPEPQVRLSAAAAVLRALHYRKDV